jgi:site-specific DNA recombinase
MSTEKKVLRAGLYARYSTDLQSEASVEDQFRVCERLAEREGFEIVARFSDAAISGGTADRPGSGATARSLARAPLNWKIWASIW